MIPNIYISAPVTLDWAEVISVNDRIQKGGYNVNVTAWDRKSYYNRDSVLECDIFVFMTPDNNWRFNLHNLPVGVKREYEKALAIGRPIFMAYKNMEGEYNLCDTIIQNNIISGLAGSTAVIWKTIENVISNPNKTSINKASQRNVVFDLPIANVIAQVKPLSKEQLAKLIPVIPSECIDYDPRLLL